MITMNDVTPFAFHYGNLAAYRLLAILTGIANSLSAREACFWRLCFRWARAWDIESACTYVFEWFVGLRQSEFES